MEPEFTVKQLKRKRPLTNYAACVICQKIDVSEGPLHNITNQGYPAILYATTNRKDEISFRLENDLESEQDFLKRNPVWHSRCHAKYTNRKSVDQKSRKAAKQDLSSDAGLSSKFMLSNELGSSAPKTLLSLSQPIKYMDECWMGKGSFHKRRQKSSFDCNP